MDSKPIVLFVCSQNYCRSQMAEAILRHLAGKQFEVASAGMEPAEAIHPMVTTVMAEKGIDISEQYPKSFREYLGKTGVLKAVIFVCEQADKGCPRTWLATHETTRLYWPVSDPASIEGNEYEVLSAFRKTRDRLWGRILAWLNEHSADAD